MIWFVQGSTIKPVADFGYTGPLTANASLFDTAKHYAEEYIHRHKLRAVVQNSSVGLLERQYPAYSVVSTDPMFEGTICQFVITEGRDEPVGVVVELSARPMLRPDLPSDLWQLE